MITATVAAQGTAPVTPRIAVVGAGPAGFYTAEHLLKKHPALVVHLIDRLPTPHGLVRAGVAPDHPKIKSVVAVYERLLRHDRLHYFGDVPVDDDPRVADLLVRHHAVVLATGAPQAAPSGLPAGPSPGLCSANDFVGWYNGHPDQRHLAPELSATCAVVVGIGNVAADVCRMLLKPPEALAGTDIAEHALRALRASAVREVVLLARRGPAQARMSSGELRELLALPDCRVIVDPQDLVLDAASEADIAGPEHDDTRLCLGLLRQAASSPGGGERCLRLRFLSSPIALLGEDRLTGIRMARTRLDRRNGHVEATSDPTRAEETVACGLLITSTGSRGRPLAGVPFDATRAVIPHQAGRVCGVAGLYVSGWIKRGARGVIGTNRADGIETAEAVLADLPGRIDRPCPDAAALRGWLKSRRHAASDAADWQRIDSHEAAAGQARGKPREKLVSLPAMRAVIQAVR